MMQRFNRFVMICAGTLLIVASILKYLELLNVYIPSWKEKGVWESWEFFLVQIPAEFCLGVWMVSGIFRKAGWLIGTLCYIFFVGVTLFKGLTGQTSCGCFGQIHINPWITLFAIDIPLAAALIICRPKEQKLLPPPWPSVGHAIGTAIPIFAVLLFAAPSLVALRPEFIKPQDWQTAAPNLPTTTIQRAESSSSPKQQTEKTHKIAVGNHLQPTVDNAPVESKPVAPVSLWPWLEYIDIADQIKSGLVIVFLYHYDCSTCRDNIPQYEAYYAQTIQKEMKEFELAFVAIPPYGKGPVSEQTLCLHGRLSDKQKWAIQSPLVVALLDGQVVKQWPQGSAPSPDTILDQIFSSM